jgi:hypothetical protein
MGTIMDKLCGRVENNLIGRPGKELRDEYVH